MQPAEKKWQVLIQSFSQESLQKIHALNPDLPLVQLYSSTETSETIQALVGLGVDGMFTNFPDRLDAVLGDAAAGGKSGAVKAAKTAAACRAG